MSKKTKMILSIVGVSAVVVPVLLLLFASSRTSTIPEVVNSKRTIDTGNLEKSVRKAPALLSSPVAVATPASASAVPRVQESSPGAN